MALVNETVLGTTKSFGTSDPWVDLVALMWASYLVNASRSKNSTRGAVVPSVFLESSFSLALKRRVAKFTSSAALVASSGTEDFIVSVSGDAEKAALPLVGLRSSLSNSLLSNSSLFPDTSLPCSRSCSFNWSTVMEVASSSCSSVVVDCASLLLDGHCP